MNFWDLPMYSARMSARLVGVSKDRVRRWVKGYDFKYSLDSEIKKISQKPLIQRDYKGGSPFITFVELIDLLFVKQFLDFGFTLQKIRRALQEAEENIGHKHFARETFFTDGHDIYLQVCENKNANGLLELFSNGQWVISPIIEDLSTRIDFDEINHHANRWYPLGKEGLIIIDPQVLFGKPTIVGHRIATDNIYNLYLGENKNIKSVCDWMNLNENEAEAAISFEEMLIAA